MKKILETGFIVIIGFIVLAATLSIYMLLDFTKTYASITGITFVLFSEFALFFGIIALVSGQDSRNNIFLNAGIVSLLLLYCIATTAICLFSGRFDNKISFLWFFEVIAFAVTVVVGGVTFLVSARIDNSDQRIESDRKLMMLCEKHISDLLLHHRSKPYEPQLLLVLEKLKYCDKIGSSSVDERIVGEILKLEKELSHENSNSDNIFEKITALISQRNTEIAENKRGGF